ncbi:hypothetical protein DENSPDRAFT_52814 [Dentipellis sp. KUC8613]|nr:hypothetical protein DENSPDRAFT_52814 [Dentipellis sp. KUC8613]
MTFVRYGCLWISDPQLRLSLALACVDSAVGYECLAGTCREHNQTNHLVLQTPLRLFISRNYYQQPPTQAELHAT